MRGGGGHYSEYFMNRTDKTQLIYSARKRNKTKKKQIARPSKWYLIIRVRKKDSSTRVCFGVEEESSLLTRGIKVLVFLWERRKSKTHMFLYLQMGVGALKERQKEDMRERANIQVVDIC